jgi:GNAT superfamily N-acetyltransferase
MQNATSIKLLDPANTAVIQSIAQWYYEEWDTPIEKTIDAFSGSNEVMEFQLVLEFDNKIVASGGLRHDVNLLNVYPEYNHLGPWIALLFTLPKHRNKGYGAALLEAIEEEAKRRGFEQIYLYTFTAESLYERAGWQTLHTVMYKEHETVIMAKDLAP